MKTNLLSLIFSLLSLLAYGQQGQARREIPTAWIEKLQKYDYKTSANELVREFQTYIAPDSLARFDKEAFLNPMFVNLDEDKEMEVLLFIGGDNPMLTGEWYAPNFCVLKKIKKKWYMIHNEQLWYHNQTPEMNVANICEPNKLFYVKKLYDYGTNSFEMRQHFYKLVEGKVQSCFEVMLKYHTPMWLAKECNLFEELEGKCDISPSGSVKVVYEYKINREKGKNILKTTHWFVYNWDKDKKEYVPNFLDKNMNKDILAFFVSKHKTIRECFQVFKDKLEKLTDENKICYEATIKELNEADKRKNTKKN